MKKSADAEKQPAQEPVSSRGGYAFPLRAAPDGKIVIEPSSDEDFREKEPGEIRRVRIRIGSSGAYFFGLMYDEADKEAIDRRFELYGGVTIACEGRTRKADGFNVNLLVIRYGNESYVIEVPDETAKRIDDATAPASR